MHTFQPSEIPTGATSIRSALKSTLQLHRELDNDRTLCALTLAQALYSPRPEVATIKQLEYFRYNYHVYSRLLLRYLEHKYSSAEIAQQKYRSLMAAVQALGRMRRNAIRLYAMVGVDKCKDIIVDAYELA